MTVIYNMSIDRADKPWIGDRRLTEVDVRVWLTYRNEAPEGDAAMAVRQQTPPFVVSPILR